MKLNITFKWLLICCLSYISSACSHQQVPLQTVFSSNNCAINEQTLKSIKSPVELNHLLRSIPKKFGQAPLALPDVDYEKESLILFALGQKPTSGYSIELYRADARLKKQKLYLPVRVQQPATGSSQAQMITSPCSIYSLPHADFSEILIEDNITD